MLDEIITGEEYCSGDPVDLVGATYRVVGITTIYGGKVQLQLRRLTKRAADGVYCVCNPNEAPYKVGSNICAVCEKPRR